MNKITEKTKKRLQYTPEGYSYVVVNRDECVKWGGFGICDFCGEEFEEGYLSFVLASCICPNCFKDFRKRRTIHTSDLELQKFHHESWYSYHLDR